jgi:membrane protein YdbS with pleckstrin-like domain
MKTFTIDPIQRARLVRALIVKLASIFGIVMVVVIGLAYVYLSQFNPSGATSNVLVMAAAVVVLAVVIAIRLMQQVREYQSGLQNLVISVGSDRIDREQKGVPALRIKRSEVTAVFETENGLLVMTKDKNRFLWLPVQLQDYANARELLSGWQVIRTMSVRSPRNTQLLTVAWAIGTALCVGILLLANDPWQVIAAGTATLAIYLFVYRLLRQQRNVDRKFRRTYSGILLFLIVIVVIKLLLTLGPLVMSR